MALKVPAGACYRIGLHRKPEVFRNSVEQSGHAAAELDYTVAVCEAVAYEQYLQLFIYRCVVAVCAHISPIFAVVCGGEVFPVGYYVAAALVGLPVAVVGLYGLLAVGVKFCGFRGEADVVVEHEYLQPVFGKVFAGGGNGGGQYHIVGALYVLKGIFSDIFNAVCNGYFGDICRAFVPGRSACGKVAHPAAAAYAQFQPVVCLYGLRRYRR